MPVTNHAASDNNIFVKVNSHNFSEVVSKDGVDSPTNIVYI